MVAPLARLAAGALVYAQRHPDHPAAAALLELADGATVPPDIVPLVDKPPAPIDVERAPRPVAQTSRYWWERD